MTFAAEDTGQILSQDARGRVLVSRERRDLLLEEYGRSGMSGVKFAKYIGIWPMGRPSGHGAAALGPGAELGKGGRQRICSMSFNKTFSDFLEK